ncbi:MAG: FAD:protein FMN transferase [Candidatus Binatia bacterium]
MSPDLAAALRAMQVLSAATDGLFDPAVGPLVERWRGPQPPVPVPTASTATRIATALTLTGRRATLVPGAALDAGGIGKGLALDAMAALLRRGGVRAAFLDFGGSSQLAVGRLSRTRRDGGSASAASRRASSSARSSCATPPCRPRARRRGRRPPA